MSESRLARGTLVVMVKSPVAGAAKSRLARAVGAAEALRFYRGQTAALLRRVARDPRWRTVLAVTPDTAARSNVWPLAIVRVPQGRGDLGGRMQRLLDGLPAGPVVIVGSDIPGITPTHVAAAFAALGSHDAVFGPAQDGGYWLIGCRRFPVVPRPFASVRWSSEHALADTLANLRCHRVARLELLHDVDTEADWRRWRQGLKASAPLRAGARRGAA